MKKVLVINEGGTVNLGDKAINEVITKKIESRGQTVCFGHYSAPSNTNLVPKKMSYSLPSLKKKVMLKVFFSINKLTFNLLGYFMWIRRNKESIKSLVNIKGISSGVIGGGQLLKGNGSFPIALYCWSKEMRKLKIPYSIYGVGVSNDMDALSKYLVKKAVNNSDKTYVREEFSKQVLLNYKVSKEIGVVPDVAFAYSDIEVPKQVEKQLLVMPASYEYVYKAYNDNHSYESYLNSWVEESFNYIKLNNWDKIIISYSTISQDRSTAYDVFQKIKELYDNVIFMDVASLSEFIDLINGSAGIYSARMHPLIIAAAYKRRVFTYRVSKKLELFEDTVIGGVSFNLESVKSEISNSIDEIIGYEK